MDLPSALKKLRDNGIQFETERDTIEQIARRNGITPMDVFGLMNSASGKMDSADLTTETLELEFSGKGLGRKKIKEICLIADIDLDLCLDRLNRAGINTNGLEIVRQVSEKHSTTPMGLLKIITLQQ